MLRRTLTTRLEWGVFENIDGPAKRRQELLMHDLVPARRSGQTLLSRGSYRNNYHRQYRFRTLLTELIRKDFLVLHQTRAHALAIIANQAVTLAKRGDTHSRQQLAFYLLDNYMVDKAFDEFPDRFRQLNGNYCAVSRLREVRSKDASKLYFVEFRNRMNSPTHLGDDTERGPERFFLPQPQMENYREREIPKHWQMIFDRWASKYKTDEFYTYWKMRHAKSRFHGYRNVPHPADVSPLWSEKEEEEFQKDMNIVPEEDVDLDDVHAQDGTSGTFLGGANMPRLT
eukprot:PhM_4_TR3833/c2_g1_i1/m.51106/K02879/RP-L17, MRPL17, rplQ; large subunit ribosomal protein L17